MWLLWCRSILRSVVDDELKSTYIRTEIPPSPSMFLYVYILEIFLSGDSEQQDMSSQVSAVGFNSYEKQRFLAYAPRPIPGQSR